MFASAGLELKLHSSTEEGVDTLPTNQPSSFSKILSMSICNDNSYIAFVRENEKPQIISIKDRQNVRLIHTINRSQVTSIAFKRNTKKYIAMGTSEGDVLIYDTKSRSIFDVFEKVATTVKTVEFTCNDNELCGIDGTTFFVFPELENGGKVNKYKTCETTCLKCHPFIPHRVALGYKNGVVGLWDAQNGVEMVAIDALTSPVSGIAMSSCGNYVIVSGRDLKICGIDFVTAVSNFKYNLEEDRAVSSVDLSPDDRLLAVGLADGTIKVYDVKRHMKPIHSSKLHPVAVGAVVFENKPRESNSNFSSMMKLSEESVNAKLELSNVKDCVEGIVKQEKKDEALDKLKKHLMKVVKNELDSLETQLQEHCVKFQKFLDNEFETIDTIIKKKWDVFNGGDMSQIIKAICPEESRTTLDDQI